MGAGLERFFVLVTSFDTLGSRSLPSPYVCNICGAEMPLRQIRAHKRSVHAELIRGRGKAVREALATMPYHCRVCDGTIPKEGMQSHLKVEHPEEFRYLRKSAYVIAGSLLALVVFLFGFVMLAFLETAPPAPPDVLEAWVYGALVGWAGLISAWGVLVDPRHKAKVRADWQSTHFVVRRE